MSNRERIAVDTSVVAAALLPWHRDHEAAFAALDEALSRATIVLPSRTLVESYSVLTRLPSPHRLAPTDALAVLEGTFRDSATIVNQPESEYWRLLRHLSQDEIAGGSTYDAEIAAAAVHGGANTILTLNRKDFERVAPPSLKVEVPGRRR